MVRDYIDFLVEDDYLNTFLDEFQKETDRAAAVLGAAYLHDLLKQLLKASFIDEHKLTNELFENQGALGEFNTCISITYSIGLITLKEAEDIHRIRKMRNEFAHQIHGLTFANDSLANRCQNFQCNEELFTNQPDFKDAYPKEPRKLFDLATSILAYYLNQRILNAQRLPRATPHHPMQQTN